ncbi:MAG TPA: glycosyltransferase family 39 protein [Vicinamibacterales bacterium]|nr:glycosyltransferase family 39 protein [Vicinamibacterales bacterium]
MPPIPAEVSGPRRLTLDRLLMFLSCAAFLLGLVTLAAGGFSFSLHGVRVSSHGVLRPFALAVASLALAAARSERRTIQLAAVRRAAERRARPIAISAALIALLIGVRYGTFTADDSDSYGYVSQAGLWLKGNLVVAQPLAVAAPWPDADWTFSPLGYRPGRTRGTIVPTYAAGLPLTMAGLLACCGSNGVYLAVPALGALAIWLTFALGRKLDNATTGAAAAVLLAVSPIFLFQLVTPMSDVPVTTWWLLALVLITRTTPASPFWSGLAASAALLTRPNLFPLVIVLVVFLASSERTARARDIMFFGLGVAPGVLAIAAINAALYGSPLQSGYGSLSTIFSLEGLRANVARYPRWLLESQTPFVCLAAGAPWLLRRRELVLLLLGMSVALFACYAFYQPFDSWLFLRFLLPAIPLLLILSSAVALTLLSRVSWKWQPLAIVTLLALLTARYWDTAVSRGALKQKAGERHFADVGLFVRQALPRDAVVLAMMHSGSVRHYSGRMTLRWDELPPEWLDPALAFLRANGYVSYLVLEPWEEAQFRTRFQGHSDWAALDWPPMAKSEGPDGTRIYDPADRQRFVAGETVKTRTIAAPASP